jgi:hypothetical protein
MTQRKSINDREKWSLGTEQESNESISESKTPEVKFVGGVYRSTLPTYSDGDNAMLHFTADGKLETTATLEASSVDIEVNPKQIAESTVPTEVSDGDEVNAWYDTFGRPISKEINLSTQAAQVENVSSIPTMTQKVTGITQLTATGNTSSINVEDYALYGYTFTVASINTNVIVGLVGSVDGTNFAELPLENTAVTGASITNNRVTITANGTYIIYSKAPISEVQFDFISESGGTTATIDADFFARDK